MTDTQLEAILTEFLRITRGFGEAIRLISEQKAEIIAMQRILEKAGVACAEEMDAARDDALKTQPSAPPGLDLLQLDDDGKWKM